MIEAKNIGRGIAAWGLALLVLLSTTAACKSLRKIGREFKLGGDHAEWVELKVRGLNKSDAVHIVAAEIEQEEFPLARQDPVMGEVESHWLMGDFDRRYGKHIRERVRAEVEREKDGSLMLRVRVQRERCDEPGLLSVPDEDEWEPHDDDLVSARTLMKRIEIVLRDFISSPSSDLETAEAD